MEESKRAVTIGLINQKGGIGKTTTTAALATSLGERGYEVLVVDNDSQRNLSSQFNAGQLMRNRGDVSRGTIAEVLLEEVNVKEVILPTEYPNVYLIPSSARVSSVEMALPTFEDGTLRLSNAVDEIRGMFDIIIFDGTPQLGKLATNIIHASDWLLIPVEGIWALSGIDTIMEMVNRDCKVYKKQFPQIGILLTKVQKANAFNALRDEIKNRFSSYLFETEIRNSIKAQEAAMAQVPVTVYTTDSSIALDYEMLTNELLSKLKLA